MPLHGGIWTLCINLSDDEIKQLRSKGFPSIDHCFNYLASNENLRNNDESRPDWQHSESQTSLRPHLSRYNNVLSISFSFSFVPHFFLLYKCSGTFNLISTLNAASIPFFNAFSEETF